MHIVLVEPEIPGNTGNISRLCAAEHLSLHLVKPLGFSLDDRHMKRAGLDYWSFLDVHVHENYGELVKFLEGHRFFIIQPRQENPIPMLHSARKMCWFLGKKQKDFRSLCCFSMRNPVSEFPWWRRPGL